VKYKEYPAHGPYSQPYSVGGSSDAAFRCQYSSNVPLTDGYLKHYVFKHYYCTVSQKNKTVNARAYFPQMLTGFQNSFTGRLSGKFATNTHLNIPPHLSYVARYVVKCLCTKIALQKKKQARSQ